MLYSCEDYGSKRPTSVINTCPKLIKKKNRKKKFVQSFQMGKKIPAANFDWKKKKNHALEIFCPPSRDF